MKTAIITGASSGLGRETAIQIADRFAGIQEIWLIARRKDRLELLSAELPVPVRVFVLDLCKKEELEQLEDALKTSRPEVKFLVNAAGYGKIGPVGGVSLEAETGMVALNCEALCAVTHLVLPYMTRESRIMQFASGAAFSPQPGFAVYAATKAFVLSYSRALGAELKHRRIAVTAVCPGPVRTEFHQIAESTGHVPIYKRLAMADPRKVVKLAIRDSMMGKPLSIYGLPMKAFHLAGKLLPHQMILTVIERFQNTDQ